MDEKTNHEKKVEKIVSGSVKTKKRSGARTIADAFMPEDIGSVKRYILTDIILPTIKKMFYNIFQNSLDAIFGEIGRSKSSTPASRVSYRSYYEPERKRDTHTSTMRNGYSYDSISGRYSYDDIIFDNRGEAEDVILRMEEVINMYGIVSVADMYDLVGIVGNHTDNKYGWTNISSAQVVRVRDGYLIKLPKALPLN